MPDDGQPDVGDGTASGSVHVERTRLYKVNPSPALELIETYLLAVGLDKDVRTSNILSVLGIEPIRNGKALGPYSARFNFYQQRKRSPLRLVVGYAPNTYRLVQLSDKYVGYNYG